MKGEAGTEAFLHVLFRLEATFHSTEKLANADCRTDLYILSELWIAAEVRPNGNETQCEILHSVGGLVGALLGSVDGSLLGDADGKELGCDVGCALGALLGSVDIDGAELGWADGCALGSLVGAALGMLLGAALGTVDGKLVGLFDGALLGSVDIDGLLLGDSLGAGVGVPHSAPPGCLPPITSKGPILVPTYRGVEQDTWISISQVLSGHATIHVVSVSNWGLRPAEPVPCASKVMVLPSVYQSKSGVCST